MNHANCSNRLINSLNLSVRNQLLAHCETVELAIGQVLSNPGDMLQHAYFPTTSLIALMMENKQDKGLEVGLIGEEGMLGIQIMIGGSVSPYKIVVQGKGMALRIPSAMLLREIDENNLLNDRLNSYISVLMQQLAQSSICNRFHLVQERLVRLLLMFHDRLQTKVFYITQDLLASMLGVRRVGVTKAASALQASELIHYVRGNLEIIDLKGLRKLACSCYDLDKATYETILHHAPKQLA
ncbi:MAG TPA: Crp/Fnr family transcriptional regulator [Methylophilus sp.]